MATRQHGTPTDLALGTRRARAALLLNLALPGSCYLYQGEELGLWEVEDIPAGVRDDPIYHRSKGADIGRDGCRVPLPWSGTRAPFGFSPDSATAAPWLPQPAEWAAHTVAALAGDPDSILRFYRSALAARRAQPCLADQSLTWFSTADAPILHFRRGDDFSCLVNLGAASITLPEHSRIVLASAPLPPTAPSLPADTAVWLRH
jgi:alpha-glucosidase